MRRHVRALAYGLATVTSVIMLVVTSGPAQAADLDFRIRRMHQGTYNHYIVNLYERITTWPEAYRELGAVSMDSDPIAYPLKRKITVCDQEADGQTVYMRVYPTGGGYIDYSDPNGSAAPCYTRTLGYPISHFRMFAYGTLSDAVEAPEE